MEKISSRTKFISLTAALSLLGTGMLSVAAAAPASADSISYNSSTSSQAALKHYQTSDRRISFDYPASWTVRDNGKGGVNVYTETGKQVASLSVADKSAEELAKDHGFIDSGAIQDARVVGEAARAAVFKALRVKVAIGTHYGLTAEDSYGEYGLTTDLKSYWGLRDVPMHGGKFLTFNGTLPAHEVAQYVESAEFAQVRAMMVSTRVAY